MPVNQSPLRYPGGKAALAPFLRELILHNQLAGAGYAEPYCGGAGAALELLFSSTVRKIYLNDIDPAIYSVWRSVTENSAKLCEMIDETPVTIERWHQERAYYLSHRSRIGPRLALATIFLNRANRSGILGAGPIGGKTQEGKWKIDARFNKPSIIDKISRIAARGDSINVSNLDAIDFLRKTINPVRAKIIVYLDPPYFSQGQSLYTNHYLPSDHQAIATFLKNRLRKPWVISYDKHPEIESLYSNCKRVDYGIRYSAQSRYFGRELIVISNELTMTQETDPLSVGRVQSQRALRLRDSARRASPMRSNGD